jgi:superfamily II DNA or RNA helicase
MPTIFDNIENKLKEGLNGTLSHATRADFCIGYFNLRGWKELYDQVNRLTGNSLSQNPLSDTSENNSKYYCRLLIGMQRLPIEILEESFSTETKTIDNAQANACKKKLAMELREQLTIGIPSNKDEFALRQLSRQLKEGKVKVKLHLQYPLHAKLYLIYRDDYNCPIIGFVGSSNLTFSGISQQGELNVDVVEQDAALKLSKWFQDRWDNRWSIDITAELINILDESWASETEIPPYYIYLKTAYHLSSEARAGVSEYSLSKRFEKELLEFQANAVKVAAHHLNKKGGVIIGDVVGLGKTITATAVAKIFEDDFFLETLIICPKNLVEMWRDYVHKYQLRAKVMSITQAQTRLGNERRYRLVIIDESHNLRNRDGKRYRAIHEYIQLNASKVILLTATPYNKNYSDLANQIRLFIDEESNLGVRPEKYIKNIGGITQFALQHQTKENTITAFEKSPYSDDWNELMRLFLVRRTRSFIRDNYGLKDKDTGRLYLKFPDGSKHFFPERIPKRVEFSFKQEDIEDQYVQLYSQQVLDLIDGMRFPRYGLGQDIYIKINPEIQPQPSEEIILKNLGRAGIQLKGFARTNLFKRLESSGYSFLLSVSRQLFRNCLFLYALENKKPLPIGKQETAVIDDYLFSDEENENGGTSNNIMNTEEEYTSQVEQVYSNLLERHPRQYDWIRSGFFTDTLKEDLENDNELLLKILNRNQKWEPEDDRKLSALLNLCNNIHPDQKILIFSQYSDTVDYIYKNIKDKIKRLYYVTGSSEEPTAIANRFSPESNGKREMVPPSEEIRVLVSTDVLSEGQNLQDAHIVVNYDLPWAIIRLIQRAGRVDRIGQKSKEILCYSFLPEDGLEKILRLRKRLQHRIQENAETIGSDEVFFEGDPINIRDLYNEKAGILDDEEDNEVDLASYAFQIWQNAVEKNPKLKKIIPDLPNVIYSSKKQKDQSDTTGAIVYSKTDQENDMLTWVDTKANIITQSQFAILKALKCEPNEKPMPKMECHHELVSKAIEYIKKVEKEIGGQLGKKNSARYRTYMRLFRYIEENRDTLFVTEELKFSVEDIYRYPLKEYARDALNRQLKLGVSDYTLAQIVVSIREEGKLIIKNEEDSAHKEPRIICSMGIVK